MIIQFSQQEITDMRRYLDRIESGETQQPDAEWTRLFHFDQLLTACAADHQHERAAQPCFSG